MRRAIAALLLPALLAASAAAEGLAVQRVGVLKFEVPNADVNGQVASDFFSTFLIRNFPGVSVVERSQLEKVLTEQQFQYTSGVIDRDTAARLQRVLGVDSLVLGSVVAVDRDVHGGGGSLMMTARLVDTSSGRILWAQDHTVRIHESGLKRMLRVFGNPSADSQDFVTDKLLELGAFELVQDLGKHLDASALSPASATASAGPARPDEAVCARSEDNIRGLAQGVLNEESLYWAHRLREEPSLNVVPGGAYDDEALRQQLTTRIFLWLDYPKLPPLEPEGLLRLARAKLAIKGWRDACEEARDQRLAYSN